MCKDLLANQIETRDRQGWRLRIWRIREAEGREVTKVRGWREPTWRFGGFRPMFHLLRVVFVLADHLQIDELGSQGPHQG